MKTTGSFATFDSNHKSISFIWLLPVLVVLLSFMFSGSFKADQAHFANDGPLGAQASRIYEMPGAFLGIWSDLYWVGSNGGNYTANFTGVLLWLLGPIGFNKFIVPAALLILGLAAALFFRQLRFKPTICILAALAAAMNSNFLSNACWGLLSRALSLAAMFFALAAAESSFSGKPVFRVIKIILAGLAIGLSVSEGGDNGAIFSLFFAAYVVWTTWQHGSAEEGPLLRMVKAGGKLAVMVAFAFFLAAQIVDLFFGFSGSGIAGLEQKGMTKEQKWSFATQWSLPKTESLRVVVPGLFGYRLDTPGGGNYWGGVGQDPAYESTKQGFPRHSGAGEYAGVPVVLIAFWALAHACVAGGAYTDRERKMIWFWGVAALFSLLFSWGRHAPFYQIVYALPYFSSIRNPMKFMHPCHMALMILFAYGLQGLFRRYVDVALDGATKVKAVVPQSFEKRWMIGSGLVVALCILGFLIFASSGASLSNHIANQGFEPQQANQMSKFAISEVGRSVFFLIVSGVVVIIIMRGAFSGGRARWAGAALGLILVMDLARASTPWIQYYSYKEKYANNGVFEVLSKNSHEHRIAMPPLQGDRNYSVYQQIYAVEWLQHQFPFYNIQSLDQPQEPRMAPDKQAYREALATNFIRLWELTNTRFLCGMAGPFVDALNQQLDPVKQRLKLHTRFTFFQNPNGVIGARVEENGPFALIEFTGALPRARLYTQWEVNTNSQVVLARLADPGFDPNQTVVVSDSIATSGASNAAASGTLEFASYAPKKIELRTDAASATLLLLNDKFERGWSATIDGESATILRCNFLMRGLQLSPGKHTVVFRFQPQSTIFYISLAATCLGIFLCGLLWIIGRSCQRTGTDPGTKTSSKA